MFWSPLFISLNIFVHTLYFVFDDSDIWSPFKIDLVLIVSVLSIFLTHGGSFPYVFDRVLSVVSLRLPGFKVYMSQEA